MIIEIQKHADGYLVLDEKRNKTVHLHTAEGLGIYIDGMFHRAAVSSWAKDSRKTFPERKCLAIKS